MRSVIRKAREGATGNSPADRLLSSALHLFYSDGVRAVGVDRLIVDAGIAKASFYAHYRSKQDLVDAYLLAWGSGWIGWLTDEIESRTANPTGRLMATFDALEAFARDREFRGCAFANALADSGGEAESIRRRAKEHKRILAHLLTEQATAAGAADPAALGTTTLLLLDGALVTCARERNTSAVGHARELVAGLIEGGDGSPQRRTAARSARIRPRYSTS